MLAKSASVASCTVFITHFSILLNSDQGLGDPSQAQCEEPLPRHAVPLQGPVYRGQIFLLENQESLALLLMVHLHNLSICPLEQNCHTALHDPAENVYTEYQDQKDFNF